MISPDAHTAWRRSCTFLDYVQQTHIGQENLSMRRQWKTMAPATTENSVCAWFLIASLDLERTSWSWCFADRWNHMRGRWQAFSLRRVWFRNLVFLLLQKWVFFSRALQTEHQQVYIGCLPPDLRHPVDHRMSCWHRMCTKNHFRCPLRNREATFQGCYAIWS